MILSLSLLGDRTYSDEKLRTPSWCDRILYLSHSVSPLIQNSYSSTNELTSSDHSPVFGTFTARTRFCNIPVDDKPAKIIITSLNGTDLLPEKLEEAHRIKEVYVTFSSTVIEQPKWTANAKTFDPEWSDTQIPELQCLSSNREFLESQLVVVSVKTTDSINNEIGQGVICLQGARKEAVPFECALRFRGLNHGTLHGNVQIK